VSANDSIELILVATTDTCGSVVFLSEPADMRFGQLQEEKKALRAVLDKSMEMQNVSGQQKGIASFFPSIDGVVKYRNGKSQYFRVSTKIKIKKRSYIFSLYEEIQP
jgi:hypothetical protein